MSATYSHCWFNGDVSEFAVGKVACVGRNYADHIKELDSATPEQPVLFLKPASAVCSSNEDILVSHVSSLGALHHELEIALLIGSKPSQSVDSISACIAGIGLGLDLTLRDIQTTLKAQGLPWERSKAFARSCVLSPFLPFNDDFDLNDLSLELELNGTVRQSSNSRMMLFSIESLLNEIDTAFSLDAGDVVLSGTPAGVGPLTAGSVVSARLNNITLINCASVI